MLPLLLHTFTCVFVLSATAGVAVAVTTETVVGVAGRTVTLPCRSAAASQSGVEVCWGRGQPSLFSCHNAVINAAGDNVTYRKSPRYTVSSSSSSSSSSYYSSSSSSSLSILASRPSDSGFYHCRVQLAGLFNDQTSSVHLIIITPARPVVSESSDGEEDAGTLNAPRTPGYITGDVTEETGSDVTGDNTTGPVVAQVQWSVQQQQVNSLQSFITNTLRVSFIIFIPALLLAVTYRVWRSESDRKLNQSEEEEEAGSSV